MAIIIEKTPVITTTEDKAINSGTILATVLVLAIIGAFVYLFSGAGKTSVVETNNTTTRVIDRQAAAPVQLPPEVPTPAYNPPSQTTIIERQVAVPVAVQTATQTPAPAAQPATPEPTAQVPVNPAPAAPSAE